MNKKIDKAPATFMAVFDSFVAAYNIRGAMITSGWKQIVCIALAILMICFADYYVKIVLGDDR